MQDNYVADIGDFGKYGLLRAVCESGMTLAVNWYKVTPKKNGKQDDGKFTSYLLNPQVYRAHDPDLFDTLYDIVFTSIDRRVAKIEEAKLFAAKYFSDDVPPKKDRLRWHTKALETTAGVDTVFLDPDNGLESFNMYVKDTVKEKHVKRTELLDYYNRGQNVILYQHRPQMTKKEQCIDGIMRFQKDLLMADEVRLLEFPRYTNRFYFMFLHRKFAKEFDIVCNVMREKWGKGGFCREIILG